MIICIPTYNRKEIKTLELLKEFNKEEIYIYVNNWDDKEKMNNEVKRLEKKYPQSYVIGAMTKGIPGIRNFILNDITDKEIVMMDDDIKGLNELYVEELKQKLRPIKSIRKTLEKGFEICRKNNTNLFGFYPINNAFYMSNKINPKGFIIGTCFGVIKSNIIFDENLKLKEDYDFTLQHIIKYKKIVRFDNISINAEHYNNSGGCVEQRKENEELEKLCTNYILYKYPKYLKKNKNRENEVLINL